MRALENVITTVCALHTDYTDPIHALQVHYRIYTVHTCVS